MHFPGFPVPVEKLDCEQSHECTGGFAGAAASDDNDAVAVADGLLLLFREFELDLVEVGDTLDELDEIVTVLKIEILGAI